VKDVTTSAVASHHFGIEREVKEITLEEMFQRMYKNDFSDLKGVLENNLTDISGSDVSVENRKFSEIVENGTYKINNHYVVPLPFRDKDLEMPNNRSQALKRLMSLKKRFMKDNSLFKDYKGFMDNLCLKGYAKESNASPRGKTWYIPHHGIYHPSKPGKIRVVFDCSAEFKGKSINNELLSGPDLTNQIVGILTRFRRGEIAFMADLEAMYYQVMVPDEQQTFLKFLWWKDGDMQKEPQEFMMCAHVFGGTSSASCSNYALRRTAVDNQAKYGEKISTVLENHFYVDDMLMSTGDLKTAKELIKGTIEICEEGGCNLTKFVSNSKELLLSIPDKLRKQCVQDQNLVGDLPKDKALGVCWNLKDDVFSFKLNIDKQSITKRVMLSIISSIYDPLGFAGPFILEGRRQLQNLCNQDFQMG